jgi:hypothetical protein
MADEKEDPEVTGLDFAGVMAVLAELEGAKIGVLVSVATALMMPARSFPSGASAECSAR